MSTYTTDDATDLRHTIDTGSDDDFIIPETVDNFLPSGVASDSTDNESVLPHTVDANRSSSPNPRVMVTKPSSTSLHNVVRYNTNEYSDHFAEEDYVESPEQVDPEFFFDDQELSNHYFVNENGMIEDADGREYEYEYNPPSDHDSGDYENSQKYMNFDDVELALGKYGTFSHDLHKLSVISDSDLEDDDSEQRYMNHGYAESYDQPEIPNRAPNARYGRADMDYNLADFQKELSPESEHHDYINYEYDSNYDQPGIQRRDKNLSQESIDHFDRSHAEFEVENQQFFDNLDRMAEHQAAINSGNAGNPDMHNYINTGLLDDLDTELENLKKFSEKDDAFNTSEVREVEALIEQKERELMFGNQTEQRSRQLSENEVDDALLALYSARIHQRKSFKKNFVKILKIKNPELADRQDIVNSVMELNNNVDRYKLKQIQDAAKAEYRMIVSSSRNSKRKPKPKPKRRRKRKRLNKNKSSPKKVDITPSKDLVKLTKEILNTFPESPTIQNHILKLNESLASYGYSSSCGELSRTEGDMDKKSSRRRVGPGRADDESDGYDNSDPSSNNKKEKKKDHTTSKKKGYGAKKYCGRGSADTAGVSNTETKEYSAGEVLANLSLSDGYDGSETEDEHFGGSDGYDGDETENEEHIGESDGYDGDETEDEHVGGSDGYDGDETEDEHIGGSDGYDGDETENEENIGESDGYDGDETNNSSKPHLGQSDGYEDSDSQKALNDSDGYDGTQSEESPVKKSIKKKRRFKLKLKKKSRKHRKPSNKNIRSIPAAPPPSIPTDYSTDAYRLPSKPALPPSGSAPKVPHKEQVPSSSPSKPPSSLSIRPNTSSESESESSDYDDDFSPLHFGSSFGSDFPGCELADIKYSDSEISIESYDTVHDDRRRELMVQRYLKHVGLDISSDLTDVEHEYDTDPDDFAPDVSGRLTASNEYLIGPRRTQSVAVMQKCDELLDDFDNLQKQDQHPVIT